MAWGIANKPKVSNKLSIPNPKEGGDGDIQVRQTGIGARLFAKLGGRWFSAKLFGNELDDPDIVMPKCWVKEGSLKSDASGKTNTLIYLPEHIKSSDIVGISLLVDYAKNGQYRMIGDSMGGKVEDRDDLTLTLASDKITIGAGTDAGTAGNFWSSDPYRLAVFFK